MSSKKEHILYCAMVILKESGDQGLTMRKLAETAGMRLSNVQYYFKTKELLLGALLEAFLVDYLASMQSLIFVEGSDAEKKLNHLMIYILNSITESDCAVVFKEIWAIAERNQAVNNALVEYYAALHNILFDGLERVAPKKCTAEQLNNAVAILLPFIEGYCITASSLKMSSDKTAKQLTAVIYTLLV